MRVTTVGNKTERKSNQLCPSLMAETGLTWLNFERIILLEKEEGLGSLDPQTGPQRRYSISAQMWLRRIMDKGGPPRGKCQRPWRLMIKWALQGLRKGTSLVGQGVSEVPPLAFGPLCGPGMPYFFSEWETSLELSHSYINTIYRGFVGEARQLVYRSPANDKYLWS